MLTGIRRAVLDHVIAACDEGVSPTVREIGAAVGLRSTGSVGSHVDALVGMGLLQRVGDVRAVRALRPTPAGRSAVGRLDEAARAHRRGVAFGAAHMARAGEPTYALEILRAAGLTTRAALIEGGIDDFDLLPLLPLVEHDG